MFSAEDCLAKAKALSDLALMHPSVAAAYLVMAEQWLDLARAAEWQDGWDESASQLDKPEPIVWLTSLVTP